LAKHRKKRAPQAPPQRIVRFGERPAPERRPAWEFDPAGYRTHHPSWGISRVDLAGNWSCEPLRGDPAALALVFDRLRSFETQTWNEIETRSRNHHHYIERVRICPAAQQRLEELQIDADQVFSLRFNNRVRLWGVREGAAFRILWWDPEHTVYPVEGR
jgi:hypothetical protein